MSGISFQAVLLIVSLVYVHSTSPTDCSDSDEAELIFANVIFRHGERNIGRGYKTDPWGHVSNWPGGFSQLTNNGKLQQYELGKYLRRRFQTLLDKASEKNINDIIYVQSTDYDRTLMSAALNLAGLFPPEGDIIGNSNLHWQPIPIHTAPLKSDQVLGFSGPCPRYKYENAEYKKNSDHWSLYKKYKPLFRYLELHTGNTIRDFFDVWDLYACFEIEKSRNMELPEWTKYVFVPGGDMEFLSTHAIVHGSETPQMARLKMGFLLREILDRFKMKIQSKLRPNRSIWMYSAHDSTVAVILNALGIFEPHLPPFCATILMELYRLKSDYYIQISYKNSTGDPIPMNIPSCGTMCPIDVFCDIYDEIIPTSDFEEECRFDEEPTGSDADADEYRSLMTALSIGFSISILLIAAISWMINYKRVPNLPEPKVLGNSIIINSTK